MADKKTTKKEYYEILKSIVSISGVDNAEELITFINNQIAMIEAKAQKNKERAAEKRAEGDALRESIQAVLTDEYQSIDAVLAQVAGDDITAAKVASRLSQLVNLGIATKEKLKGEGGSSYMAYCLADSAEVEM